MKIHTHFLLLIANAAMNMPIASNTLLPRRTVQRDCVKNTGSLSRTRIGLERNLEKIEGESVAGTVN